MRLRNIFLIVTRRFSALQRVSDGYWRASTDTYLGDAEFYEARDAALRGCLAQIGGQQAGVDVGCGDGRFAAVLGEHVAHTRGYDLSPSLIDLARARYPGIEFYVSDIDQIPDQEADVVTCLGVTSCLVDDRRFNRAIRKLHTLVARGGFVIVSDTLSEGIEFSRAYRSGYVAKHRSLTAYKAAFSNVGFEALNEHLVTRRGGALANWMFVWRRL